MKVGDEILIENNKDFNKIPNEFIKAFGVLKDEEDGIIIEDKVIFNIDYPFTIKKSSNNEYFVSKHNVLILFDTKLSNMHRIITSLY